MSNVFNVHATTEEMYARMQVCEQCDKYLKLAKICGMCRCFMPLKTRIKNSVCPDGKWN